MGATQWALLLTLSLLWGGAFFFSEVVLDELSPFTVVFARVALAAIALHVAVLASGHRMPRSARTWVAFVTMGAINNLIPFSLILWGQTHITGGLAAILTATTTVFTILLAHFLTRDNRLTANRVAGVLCGLGGVTVMIGPDALDGLGGDTLGQLAVLAAALSYSCAGIFAQRFRAMPALIPATGQVTATTFLALPLALAIDRPWTEPMPSVETVGAIIGLALLSTALAYAILFRLLAVASVTNVVLVTLLIPPSSILLGAAFLEERLEPRSLLGMALIFLGLLTIDGRLLSSLRRRSNVPSRTQPAE